MAAGPDRRLKFIRDAILWRLDQDIPPVVLDLARELEQLRRRVENLERAQSPSLQKALLGSTSSSRLCRDELDRKILIQLLQQQASTTTELAESLLGSASKRTTILNRIKWINAQARAIHGRDLLVQERGVVDGKRGAWRISEPDLLTS